MSKDIICSEIHIVSRFRKIHITFHCMFLKFECRFRFMLSWDGFKEIWHWTQMSKIVIKEKSNSNLRQRDTEKVAQELSHVVSRILIMESIKVSSIHKVSNTPSESALALVEVGRDERSNAKMGRIFEELKAAWRERTRTNVGNEIDVVPFEHGHRCFVSTEWESRLRRGRDSIYWASRVALRPSPLLNRRKPAEPNATQKNWMGRQKSPSLGRDSTPRIEWSFGLDSDWREVL